MNEAFPVKNKALPRRNETFPIGNKAFGLKKGRSIEKKAHRRKGTEEQCESESADGVAWYEVQDLRHLRSDRFLGYDIDLDATIAQWGLSYSSEFQIRFCQYDNNPAPMDGIFLHKIELLGDLRPPILHLTMNDNASNPTVLDSAASQRHQTFIDPCGNPNTNAHSVPGPNGATALAFDGVDDRIDFGPTLLSEMVGAGRDFTLAFWYKTDSSPGDTTKIFFRRRMSFSEPHVMGYVTNDRIYWLVGWSDGYMCTSSAKMRQIYL